MLIYKVDKQENPSVECTNVKHSPLDLFSLSYTLSSLKPFPSVLQGMDDVQVRGAATDIFSYLVEYNPSMVREFVMQESQQNDDVSDSVRNKESFAELY